MAFGPRLFQLDERIVDTDDDGFVLLHFAPNNIASSADALDVG